MRFRLSQSYIWDEFFIIIVTIYILDKLIIVTPQTFIRNCNDPAIVEHIVTFRHTYCSHACRPGDEADGVCSASGNCVCSPPCSNDAASPPITPSNDLCPRQSGDPRDPDPMFSEANCMTSCATECAGGTGLLCEEINGALFTPNTYASICTCSCPTVLCGTPVTPAPGIIPIPGTNSTNLALLKLPLLYIPKKKKILKILKKLWLFCILFVKLFFIKTFLLGLYFYAFWDYIDMDIRFLEWVLRSFI